MFLVVKQTKKQLEIKLV